MSDVAEIPMELEASLNYLRREAIDAHLAGDGMKVLHICTTAIEHLRHVMSKQSACFRVRDYRWVCSLILYWMLDDWNSHLIESLLNHLQNEQLEEWDSKLIRFLLFTLRIPVNFEAIDELMGAPAKWLESRSHSIDDVASLSLAIEITWYKDPGGNDWRQLAEQWLSQLNSHSALKVELVRLVERLSLQSHFCESGQLPDQGSLPVGLTGDQSTLIEGWRQYFLANTARLSDIVQQLAKRVRIDSSIYPAFFWLTHFSRMDRDSKESQFCSLSRLQYVQSRQPSQAYRQARNERYWSKYSDMAQKGFSDRAASERFTCFRMAMLNQLHALRGWDIGGWLIGERQRAEMMLEIASKGDATFVGPAIIHLVQSLGVPDKGKYPDFDRTIELFDALPETERREIARRLIQAPRLEWRDAYQVLSQVLDAIPIDLIEDFAEWNRRLDGDDHYARWRHTWLDHWGELLHWAEESESLVESLKPALLVKSSDFRCWEPLHSTMCSAITKGRLSTARELLSKITGAECSEPHANQYRFSIVYNVAQRRGDLKEQALEWLRQHSAQKQDIYNDFLLRHIDDHSDDTIDDAEFRSWISRQIIDDCCGCLTETRGSIKIGIAQYSRMVGRLSWPQYDSELTDKLIEVVDAENVPFANKSDKMACLAILALQYPRDAASRIAIAAVSWLTNGVRGVELGHSSPLSTARFTGLAASSIDFAFGSLVESLSERHFEIIGESLIKWVLTNAVRRPASVVGHTLLTIFNCSIGSSISDTSLAVALVGLAEGIANACYCVHPEETMYGFRSLLKLATRNELVSSWFMSSAGSLCLELWKDRIVEVAALARPSAREAAAIAIKDWEIAGFVLPDVLSRTRDRLKSDCRLRVRRQFR